ncbi:hypothetical protein [Nakamurella leprariae]|uniref:Uncharacterized protein n=1 Tax=Nakamurella leprariae TaxID=2803911 RepID=A0A938Y838_9ACTN|nr:hypothetical protein [Nakamurella leprariae]MBM9465692.1 hypothetical protein [Nakamurella leprariae]
MSAPGFRGLPFLAPLYGSGPYDYTNGMVAMVNDTVTRESLLEVLPRELEPLGEPTVSMTFPHSVQVHRHGPAQLLQAGPGRRVDDLRPAREHQHHPRQGERGGRTVIAAEARVSVEPFDNTGGIASLDTTGTDVATSITSMSEFTRVNWQAG